MTRLRGPIAVSAAVALFLLSACARGTDGASAAPAGDASAPAAADEGLVLRVKQEGGFAPPEFVAGRIPRISVYADGRVITEGPQIAIYPGPALPNLQVQQIDRAKVGQLVEQALTAGVGSGADLGRPGVADVPATVIEAHTTAGAKITSVEALTEASPDDTALTEAHRAARAKLAAFVEQLAGLGDAASQPYREQTLAALVKPYVKPADVPGKVTEIAWPGPALPGEPADKSGRLSCVTVTGAELDKVLAAAKEANQNTAWTSGGKQYSLTFRPLLPDETGCADLKAAR